MILSIAPKNVRSTSKRAAAVLGLMALGSVMGGTPVAAEELIDARTKPDYPDAIVVGFRADAEPFSYRLVIDGEEQYVGYIADLCHDLFDNSNYEVLPVEITATNRFDNLRRPEDPPRDSEYSDRPTREEWENLETTERLKHNIDVLCDPITLRYDIVETPRTSGIFSPIIFASGISYLHANANQAGTPDPFLIDGNDVLTQNEHAFANRAKPILIGYIANSTASDIAEDLCDEDHFGNRARADARIQQRTSDSRATKLLPLQKPHNCGAPKVSTVTISMRQDPRSADANALINCDPAKLKYRDEGEGLYRFCVKETHGELIDWFCSDPVAAYHRVYLGDRDLILGKLASWEERNGRCGVAKVVPTPAFFSYEPYALLVTSARPELVRHVQRRVYEFFSDRDGALALFVKYFPTSRMSHPLAYLHLINAVSPPDMFKHAMPKGE